MSFYEQYGTFAVLAIVGAGLYAFIMLGNRIMRPSLPSPGKLTTYECGVDSVGTGSWHVGDGADARALATLHAAGYDGSAHRARHLDPVWLGERDLVLCADDGHLRTVRRLGRGVGTPVHLLREFDPEAGANLDLADP